MSRLPTVPLALLAVLLLAGCPPADPTPENCFNARDDDGDGDIDCDDSECAGNLVCEDGDDDTGDDDVGDDDAAGDDDSAAAPASLSGTITRSVAAPEDGIGNVFVAVFAVDPFAPGSELAEPLAQTVLYMVDLSADGASVAYTVPGIPVDPSERVVAVVFNDNDDNVGKDFEPDDGDLFGRNGGDALPTVLLDTPGDHTLDLVLDTTFAELAGG